MKEISIKFKAQLSVGGGGLVIYIPKNIREAYPDLKAGKKVLVEVSM